eukprot:TRINITY_DN8319_c0_g1_i1.p1 TRINITY_DN8319_c0_g1~~TRINITY_DN8319_c0_g1_i1.p1  ORF type:complete len:124 (+),score=17.02 TRINITY_DN8319_c0_g1_i1:46-372(+)
MNRAVRAKSQTSIPTPPEKGSFPIDRQHECSKLASAYSVCLSKHNNNSTMCMQEAKEYLGCRMDKGLMAKESWEELGYGENQTKPIPDLQPYGRDKEQQGFIAGSRRR